jgi:hypothetical protein
MEPMNRFQGINSASLSSLASRYDNPIPTRCLAPIDFLKIPALAGRYDNPIPPRCLAPIDSLKIPALDTIEEGRAASKSPHYKFGYFISIYQQVVSADTYH